MNERNEFGPGGGIRAYGNTAVVLQNTTVANNGAVLFGLTGNSAINNAIGGSASLNTWSAIRAFLNGNCGSTFAL